MRVKNTVFVYLIIISNPYFKLIGDTNLDLLQSCLMDIMFNHQVKHVKMTQTFRKNIRVWNNMYNNYNMYVKLLLSISNKDVIVKHV